MREQPIFLTKGDDDMKERPILFSGAMVRVILSGVKTQTRRVVKPQPANAFPMKNGDGSLRGDFFLSDPIYERVGSSGCRCPYGQPGDRLWVRETHVIVAAPGLRTEERVMVTTQFLDGQTRCAELTAQELQKLRGREVWCLGDKTPGIFMFRSQSRITLEIVSVRVERLQDISEADAMAEGIERDAAEFRNYDTKHEVFRWLGGVGAAKLSYASLWESINGPESWALNPWVWVVEFKRI